MRRLTVNLGKAALVAAVFLLAFAQAAQAKQKVKNVIFMIGDGMGVGHVSALIIENNYATVNMERAQAVGLVRTNSANNRVTDSAASGTAYSTGQKTKNSYVGLDSAANKIENIIEKAEKAGLGTGIVVTCYLQHATPATFYGHVRSRYKLEELAEQFAESGIDVAMGSGYDYFTKRKDGRNLLQEMSDKGYRVVSNIDELDGVQSGRSLVVYDYGKNVMPMISAGRGDYLPRATAKSLEILGNTFKKGFFVMVEGSLIDYAAHDNDAKKIFEETADFDKAVGVAFDYADNHPGTLVIVLADHETGGLSIASKKTDFTQGESGIDYRFGSTSHTGTLVPLFAYGTGAENFGRVMDNTEVSKTVQKLMGLK